MASSWRSVMAWRGSPGVGPLGHGGRRVEVEPAVADEEADHGVQHGLGHRPAEQRRLRRHRRGRAVEVLERALVALGHHLARGGRPARRR